MSTRQKVASACSIAAGAAVVVAVVAALALPAGAAKIDGAKHGGRPVTLTLTGAAERPHAGDPDGSGVARLTFNAGQEEVCVDIDVTKVAPLTAAHIHVINDPALGFGPVLIPLPTDTGCVHADRSVIKAIHKNPERYYVNVHNADFQAGALRGNF